MTVASGEGSRWERGHDRVGETWAKALLDDMSAVGQGEGRVPWSLMLAYALALPVVVASVGLGAVGTWFMLVGDGWVVRVLGGLGLAAALAVHLRRGHDARDWVDVDPAASPALTSLLTDVGRVAGANVPQRVVIVPDFNAFVTRTRGRTVLAVGAPLWLALPPGGRIALLGHELGHLAHRDLLTGGIIGEGLHVARFWWGVFADGPWWYRLLVFPIRAIITAYRWALYHSLAATVRRQEYRCDLTACRTGGSDGASALLATVTAASAFVVTLNRAAVDPARPDLGTTLMNRAAQLTDTQLAGYRARATEEKSRIDDTHPATHLRLDLVDRLSPCAAGVVDQGRCAQVDQDIAPALARAMDRVGETFRYQH